MLTKLENWLITHPTEMLWVADGPIDSNKMLLAKLSTTKQDLLPKALPKHLELISMTHLPPLPNL